MQTRGGIILLTVPNVFMHLVDQTYHGSVVKNIIYSGLSREFVSAALELLAD